MEYNGLPEKQGLYDPQFEHDACGIGFIANIKGKTSHGIINQAIQILKNLAHRIRIQEKKVLKDLQRLLTVKSGNFSV